jgi:hypothetical protein
VTCVVCPMGCIIVLQSFRERSQAQIESWRIIPESCMSRVHHLNLSVSYTSLVLIDRGWFDDSIINAMHNQHRLAYLR